MLGEGLSFTPVATYVRDAATNCYQVIATEKSGIMPESLSMQARESVLALRDFMNSRILGQQRLCSRMLIALLADGHILVEGPPGLAKTRAVKTLASGVQGGF